MSFFGELPQPEVEPDPEPEVVADKPEWAGPVEGSLPALTSERIVMFHTDRVAMTIDRFEIYSTGLLFTASLFFGEPRTEDRPWLPWHIEGPVGFEDPDQVLRLGLLFSDGARWANTDQLRRGDDEGTRADSIFVRPQGGSSGSQECEMTFWVWPLPPPGPLTFVTAWPAYDIDERTTSIDGGVLRARSADCIALWPA